MTHVRRQMTLDDEQTECLSTCMQSCRNIPYPVSEMIEELREFLQKLKGVIIKNHECPYLDEYFHALDAIIDNAETIARLGKQMRHQDPKDQQLPFSLMKFSDMDEFHDAMLPIWKELGDIRWGVCVTEHFLGINSQMVADIRWEKLQARKLAGTIDGKGDDVRTSIDE